MTISIVTGLPGFGKTNKLCEFAIKAMAQGKNVYANFKMINLPHPERYTHFNNPMEVLGQVKNALILMSELGILLDQFKMWDMPLEVWEELRQHRKDGVNIIGDAQSMGDVAYPFRKLIQFQYHIYAKYKFNDKVTIQRARVFNPQPKGDDYGRRFWLMQTKYWNYYDTNYKLEKTPTLYDLAQERVESPFEEYNRERFYSWVKEKAQNY